MFNDTVQMTPYYIEHYEDIQEKYPTMPVEEQMLICNAKDMEGIFLQSPLEKNPPKWYKD